MLSSCPEYSRMNDSFHLVLGSRYYLDDWLQQRTLISAVSATVGLYMHPDCL
jgi:hypothetical protein